MGTKGAVLGVEIDLGAVVDESESIEVVNLIGSRPVDLGHGNEMIQHGYGDSTAGVRT